MPIPWKWRDGGVVDQRVETRSIILTFHGVGAPMREFEPSESDFWLSRDRFLSVLDSVAGREDVRITFDDGNASDVEHALPALRERGLRATFFVVASRIGKPAFLDAGAIRELTAAGMVIGCHGMRHRRWRRARRAIAARGARRREGDPRGDRRAPVVEAACPFGSYDRRVAPHAARRGLPPRLHERPRHGAARGLPAGAQHASGGRRQRTCSKRIVATDAAPFRAWARRAKLAVKRWR